MAFTRVIPLFCLWAGTTTYLAAADLTVRVTGLGNAPNMVSCTVFNAAEGFPESNPAALTQWVASNPAGVSCTFAGLKPGTYAVSIFEDLNGNRKLDANWLGIPKEPTGVSNNVRPIRKPRFDEASFTFEAVAHQVVEIKVE
jgi:uncharacterized protein (DUF2141 family)